MVLKKWFPFITNKKFIEHCRSVVDVYNKRLPVSLIDPFKENFDRSVLNLTKKQWKDRDGFRLRDKMVNNANWILSSKNSDKRQRIH